MIGDKIKKERLLKGYTQNQLAEKLGLSASTIGMYEQNRRMPDFDIVMKLSQILNVTPVYLMGWESYHENNIQTSLRGIEVWSNNKFLSDSEREAIKMHFAELLIRYKILLNSTADKKLNLKNFEEHYASYNKSLKEPLNENEIKELFWRENLSREIENLSEWINSFIKYLSGVYKSD